MQLIGFVCCWRYIIGQFAFAHAETLGPLYAALGVFSDKEALRADNFHAQKGRLFRTSLILPFAANLQFVLYECEPQEPDTTAEDDETETIAEYYLKLLVNERVEKFPGCEEEMCPYTKVREALKEQIDECNFVQMCKVRADKDELWYLWTHFVLHKSDKNTCTCVSISFPQV